MLSYSLYCNRPMLSTISFALAFSYLAVAVHFRLLRPPSSSLRGALEVGSMNGSCSRGGAAFRGDTLIGRGATVIILLPYDLPASLSWDIFSLVIIWLLLSLLWASIGYLVILFILSAFFLVASALVKFLLDILLYYLIGLYYFSFLTFLGKYLGIRLFFFRLSIYISSTL